MRGRRPIVTGTGIFCAAGRGLPAVWETLATGRSALQSLTLFDSPRYGSHAVGQIEANLRNPPGLGRGSRSDHLARIAAREALDQAGVGLPPNLATAEGWGVVVGATVGGMDLSEQFVAQVLGAGRPDYRALRFHDCGGIADRLAAWLGIHGPTVTLSTACSAGALALATAAAMIDRGEADRVLAGGCDALCRLTLNGFGSLLLLDPAGCRPFDARRAGISLGEGAAFLVLEAEESAQQRGARPLARLSGFGTSCDAWHATAPQPEGRGAAAAMQAALSSGRIEPAEIDFVCAHGTGTPDNDVMEARALRSVFGEHVPPFSSNKRCFGHTLAASGALNAVLCVQAIRSQALPPNPGFDTPDPAIGLEPIRTLQHGPVRHVLSNAFGFGGNNVTLLLSLPDQSAAPRTLPVSGTPGPFFRSPRFSARFPILGAAAVGPAGDSLEQIYASAQGAGPAPADQQLPPRLGGHHLRVLACGDGASASVPDRALARRLSRIQLRVLATARDSVAGVAEGIPGNRCCVTLGTALGLLSDTAAFVENMVQRDERAPRPTHFTNSVHNALASQVAVHLGFTGLNATLTQRDTSFEAALWHAVNELAADRADLAVAGAADELHSYGLAAGLRWGWWSATAPNSAKPGADPAPHEPSPVSSSSTLDRNHRHPALHPVAAALVDGQRLEPQRRVAADDPGGEGGLRQRLLEPQQFFQADVGGHRFPVLGGGGLIVAQLFAQPAVLIPDADQFTIVGQQAGEVAANPGGGRLHRPDHLQPKLVRQVEFPAPQRGDNDDKNQNEAEAEKQ